MFFFMKEGKNYKAVISRVLREYVHQQKQAVRRQRQKRCAS